MSKLNCDSWPKCKLLEKYQKKKHKNSKSTIWKVLGQGIRIPTLWGIWLKDEHILNVGK